MTRKFKYHPVELPFYEYEGGARHVLQLIKDEVQKIEDSGCANVEMWFDRIDGIIVLKGHRLESDEEYAQRLMEEEARAKVEKEAEEKRAHEEYLRLKAKYEPNN